jgi:xylan 1,4-beta-xylosidase
MYCNLGLGIALVKFRIILRRKRDSETANMRTREEEGTKAEAENRTDLLALSWAKQFHSKAMKSVLALFIFGLAATAAPPRQKVSIQVNASEILGPMKPVWSWVGHDEPNYAYSDEGRELLRTLSLMTSCPFHDRTHNLLTSGDGVPSLKWGSTNVYTLDANGQATYDWAVINRIFDTYRATRISPFVEIGFMPKSLSTHPAPYRHHWPKGPLFTGWSYPPKNYKAWSELVYRLVRHLAERYGDHAVEGWEWEVWNEPDIGYWHGSLDEYCKLYDFTTAAVKRALPNARVGGPATTGPANPSAAQFLRGFLTHCVNGRNFATDKTGAPLDFISFHAKGQTEFKDGHVEMNIGHHLRDIDRGFDIIASFPTLRKLPVVISESDPEGCAACSVTAHPEDGYRLTSQYGSYEAELLTGTLALAKRYNINLQGAVTWAFVFPGQPYFAGYRALATHGIPLPILDVFRMFGMMTGERIAVNSTGALSMDHILESSARTTSDIRAMATRESKGINVLIWNYDDDSEPRSPTEINLTVAGLPKGVTRVLLECFGVDRDHGNPFDVWRAMGSPQSPSRAQYKQLRAAGQLRLLASPKWIKVKRTTLELNFSEASQGVSLLKLKW